MQASKFRPPVAVAVLLSLSCSSTECWADFNLDSLLTQHEAQLAQLRTAEISWSVKYRNQDRDLQTETFRTTLAPNFQATTRNLTDGKPIHCWWDGKASGRIDGYDPRVPSIDGRAVMRLRASLFHDDQPIQRLFDWRTLRTYRFFANDPDLSLRELCQQAPTPPKISREGSLIRLDVAHPGVEPEPSRGISRIPRGTRVLVDIDPGHGHLVKRHRTTIKFGEADDDFTQTLEVVEYDHYGDKLVLPKIVKYSLAVNGELKMQQDIEFAYSKVNEAIDVERLRFLPSVLVREFDMGDAKPLGFYVVTPELSLGQRYASELIARLVQAHSVGLIDESTLKSRIEAIHAAPKAGSKAPGIVGLSIHSDRELSIEFDGRVTVIEFWSTTCGPCEGAMESFDKLAADGKARWSDKVKFVTVCLGDDLEVVRKFMDERGWINSLAIIDTLTDEKTESVGFPFNIANDYGVSAIPTCLIVDQSGQIVYRGNSIIDQPFSKIEHLLDGP